MKKFSLPGIVGVGLFLITACNTATATPMTKTQAPTILSVATITSLSASITAPPATQEPASFPLSERGPYWSGNRAYTFIDNSRDGRRIDVQIYYPAIKQTNDSGGTITRNALADMSGAPYPLILTGSDTGDYLFKSHLASHGFVMAIVRFPVSYNLWDFGVIDNPLDMLFVLDQISSNSLEGLIDVIDSNRVGVAGYSWEGFHTQMLGGVRIDPEYYRSFCEQAPTMDLEMSDWYLNYVCNLSKKWDAFAAYVGDEITTSDDGLWQPITDERIYAVMPMAEYGTWLYGEQGLATADRPTFIIAPTEDEYIPYQETVYVFEHNGSRERFLVSFVGKSHMMVTELGTMKRINHFATAFFGYYLQGKSEYRDYFTEDFVNQFDDLAWGVYEDK